MLAAAGTSASHAEATPRPAGRQCARCFLHRVKCNSRVVDLDKTGRQG